MRTLPDLALRRQMIEMFSSDSDTRLLDQGAHTVPVG
jgi:hypothetical protein